MMEFEGDNFPPPQHRIVFSQFLSIAKMLVIVLLVMGINPFDYFNMATPNIWHWLMGNKLYGALMVMFLTNAIENHLMSTGTSHLRIRSLSYRSFVESADSFVGSRLILSAFEVWLNGIPVWSKLESGRVPNPPEMFQIIDNALQMKMSPEDSLRSHFADGSATVMS
ncbi:unnamed protein product [Cyprideis torosa]|uniref:Uncharacterized protein n=1 Tax=Cyprideis torosa TaxID=163714 RepID=A0A7R8WG56_9CRUS|nr:unnamed protein product [Cyprideis torosa]CAG0891404.1 unnamed protein product [Cyprideis torosa]